MLFRSNFITAFRFFPNAQPELRKEVMGLLRLHLEDNGYLVFNNHKNTGSCRNRLYKLFNKGSKGMSVDEVKDLISENKLELVKTYHLGVFPAAESRTLLPIFLLRPVDKLLSKCRFLQNYGENLIFVCRHFKSHKE